jgi:hypothetical protein
MKQSDVDRFWKLVSTGEIDDCWHWQGAKNKNGYGRFSVGGKTVPAHAFALSLSVPRPGTAHCLHSCDNPPCCNPAHLRWGSPKENNDERHSKGRTAKGERVGTSVLSDNQRMEIKTNWQPHQTYSEVAVRYGVSRGTIKRLVVV